MPFLTDAPIDVAALLQEARSGDGALCLFVGVVRDHNEGRPTVAIAAVAPHRAEAFAACRAAIDRVKATVPIWKKEFHPDGSSDWVDPSQHAEAGDRR